MPVLVPVRFEEHAPETLALQPSTTKPMPGRFATRPSRKQLLLVLLLVALTGFVLLRVLAPSTEAPVAAPPVESPGAAAPIAPASVNEDDVAFDETVQELQRFVAKHRELEFQRPVKAVRLDDEAFQALFLEQHPREDVAVDDIRDFERVLKAFGLVSPGYDFVENYMDPATRTQGLLGWYDVDGDKLYVRGGALTPLVKSVIVHELVHALDDQHFDIKALLEREGDREEGLAASALVEGNAERIEKAYIATLSASERAALVAEGDATAAEDGMNDDELEMVDYFGAFPYINGPDFVEALVKNGGEASVNAAFRRPPSTTAEILEPDRYRIGLTGSRLAAPTTPTRPVGSGMFGELGLILLLAEAVGPDAAATAAVPWEADSYVAYEDGDRMCVKLHILLEDPWSTELTAQILAGWASQQIDATVRDLGIVEVTSCR